MDSRENMNIAMNDDELEKVAGGKLVLQNRNLTWSEVPCKCNNGHKWMARVTYEQEMNRYNYDGGLNGVKLHYEPCPVCGISTFIW